VRSPLPLACILIINSLAATPAAGQTETHDVVRIPSQDTILKTLKAERPRLLIDQAKVEELRGLVKTDPLAKKWYAKVKRDAKKVIDQPVLTYDIPDGRRLLEVSRRACDRMYLLGFCYLVDQDRKYADRAWQDLQAAAKFPDWNPSHFLDTAEMSAAFGIAYDWMHDAWTDKQKKTLRDALIKHGLKPGLKGYAPSGGRKAWWSVGKNNWNQVCNGGLLTGALALADEEPKLAATIAWNACKGLPIAMKHFSPDGGWYEGPSYWGYAMRYNVLALACLDSALGKDFGLSKIKGFDKAGDFYLQMRGTSGKSFNYADAGATHIRHSALFWLAAKFNRPALAKYQAQYGTGGVTDLLWYDPKLLKGDVPPLPNAASFAKVEVAAARSSWTDPNAPYVAVKAGRNGVSHAHLDLGSFVFDALGERWIHEIGADDYNLPGFFGGKRYEYYRVRAEGQNTLVINPAMHKLDQDVKAFCQITRCETTGKTTEIETDLTPAYAKHGASKVIRTCRLTPSQLVITDQIALKKPGEAWWFAHVRAKTTVAADGRSATISQRGKSVTVHLIKPAGAKLVLMPAQPLPSSPDPDGQNPNDGSTLLNPAPGKNRVVRGDIPKWGKPINPRWVIHKLAVHVTDVTDTTIEVAFKPTKP
jgi:hypothetical protein